MIYKMTLVNGDNIVYLILIRPKALSKTHSKSGPKDLTKGRQALPQSTFFPIITHQRAQKKVA